MRTIGKLFVLSVLSLVLISCKECSPSVSTTGSTKASPGDQVISEADTLAAAKSALRGFRSEYELAIDVDGKKWKEIRRFWLPAPKKAETHPLKAVFNELDSKRVYVVLAKPLTTPSPRQRDGGNLFIFVDALTAEVVHIIQDGRVLK